jgi:hypothetical protein
MMGIDARIARLSGRASHKAWVQLQRFRHHPQIERLLAYLEDVEGTVSLADIDNAVRHVFRGEGTMRAASADIFHSLSSQFVQEPHEALEAAISLQGADKGNIQIIDDNSQLRIVAQRGFERDFLEHFAFVRFDGSSACAKAFRAGAPVVVTDVREDPSFNDHLAIMQAAGIRAVQSIPLLDASDRVIGMLSVHFRTPLPSPEWRTESLQLSAARAAAVLRRHST